MDRKRMNFILITADSLRADAVDCCVKRKSSDNTLKLD